MLTMKYRFFILLIAIVMTAITSCKKGNGGTPTPNPNPNPNPNPTPSGDTTLKAVASFPIGIAIEYDLFKNNASYRNVVVREADQVTFGYSMKHGAIVKNDGSFDYSKADELLNLATAAGLQVYGHTLVWHANQNGDYLRSLTIDNGTTSSTNLLPAGDFETGSGSSFTGWSVLVGGTASGSYAAVTGNSSARALEATVIAAGANAWDMQALGPNWTATVGTQYKVSVDIKASVNNGKVKLVNQNNQYQASDITPTTSWATYTWILTAAETSSSLRLNFPSAGVYTIDNIKINEVTAGAPLPAAQAAANIDTAMSRFIRNSATRYAGKVRAWDVLNEAINDGTGTIRNSGTETSDAFFWAKYLGRDYAVKAFNYAKAADPSALLFINDYNLEYDSRKLDSLIAYVNEIKTKGATVDGIGTQMHININTSKTAIDNMFVKLAATGLKVRVSELDVRVNPNNLTGFIASAQNLSDQAEMYKYVAQSFIKNVPAAQRYDFTIWGVADSDSWIVTALKKEDYPLLFDANYKKKAAYASLLQGLKP
jgi:endo-1,4-beta-xylanase